jgi:hypothetical protein
MHSFALKVGLLMGGAVVPGLVAGVIYFVIALTTGVSTSAALASGIVVAAVAVTIGLVIRSLYERRSLGSPR